MHQCTISKFLPGDLLFVQNQHWRHIVWCLSCALNWTTVTTLYIFKVWGLAAFRSKGTDRWSGCSLFSLSSVSASCWSSSYPPMITVHMLTTTEGLAFGCWLNGVGLSSSRVVKRSWQTISGLAVCVWWSFYIWSLPKWNEASRQRTWPRLHPLPSDDQ